METYESLLKFKMVESHKWFEYIIVLNLSYLAGKENENEILKARLITVMIAALEITKSPVSAVLVVAGGQGVDSDLQEAVGEGAEAGGTRAIIIIISNWRILWVHGRVGSPDLLPEIEASLANIADESEESAEPLGVVEDLDKDEEGAEGSECVLEVVEDLGQGKEESDNHGADQVGPGSGGHFAIADSVPILIPGQHLHPVPQPPGPARVHPSHLPDRGQAEDHFIPRRRS